MGQRRRAGADLIPKSRHWRLDSLFRLKHTYMQYGGSAQMQGLSRSEFMALTGLTTTVFDARARRGQFPWGTPAPADRAGKWYGAHWALLTIVADALHDDLGIRLDPALRIARAIADVMSRHLPAIYQTAQDYRDGRKTDPILGGGYRTPERWSPVCGRLRDCVDPKQFGFADSRAIALVSMTEAAALMIERAEAKGVDIAELWGGL
jgi:hypothetical protein